MLMCARPVPYFVRKVWTSVNNSIYFDIFSIFMYFPCEDYNLLHSVGTQARINMVLV